MNMHLGDTQIIIGEARRQGLSKVHTAYVLATAKWETNHTMKPVREAYWLSETWRRQNLRYYPWYGRGYVQLTWKDNYSRAGQNLGIDLTSDPDVVMQPDIAAKILVRGCKEGWFTGKKLSDYRSYEDMRRVVNATDKAVEIADIARQYEKALSEVSNPVPITPKKEQNPNTAVIGWSLILLAAAAALYMGLM